MTNKLDVSFCLALSLVAVGFAPVAHAERAKSAKKVGDDEEALIQRGLDLRDKNQDEQALEQFSKAFEISRSGRAGAQMALAEQALGRWVDAEAHLGEAVRHLDEPWIARNRGVLEQSLAEIRSHLGTLELSGGVAGAEVQLNGRSVGAMPLAAPLRAPAGSNALQVSAPGHLPVARTVIVPAGGIARETIVLVPIAESSAPATPAPAETKAGAPVLVAAPVSAAGAETRWSTSRTVGAALIAGSGAALVTAVVFTFVRDSRAKTFNADNCTTAVPGTYGPAGCKADHDAVEQALYLAIGGYGAAAVLAGVGIPLLMSTPGDPGAHAASAGIGLALRCGPSLERGFACAGLF
ncbi:MAG TPA: PEGA domain-containing protein [Polyangia bacterium]|nr:PEGA domain-containing protein [Polyangia bacterium]